MDWASHSDGTLSHVCSGCEQSFAGPGSLNFHRHSCRTTKRQLQGALAKGKELWEAKKLLNRHPLDKLQPEMAISRTADPLTQAQGPVTTLTTEAGCPPVPMLSAPIHVDSMGAPDAVCGQAGTVDR
jgi:hypothetical protein